MNDSILPSGELWLECFGHPTAESIEVDSGERHTHFVFSDRLNRNHAFHAGLYVDYAASTPRIWRRYPFSRRFALLCEPNASDSFVQNPKAASRFPLIFTHDSRLLDRGIPYIETPFGTSFVESVLAEPLDFRKSKLISMIGAVHSDPKAGHVLRNKVIEWLQTRTDVDRFGRGVQWIDSKVQGLRDYAFSIAMENGVQDYYFSEKAIDCFLTDTVPIYYGCRSIGRYFDTAGMICFDTLSDLERIINKVSWEQYQEMLPVVRVNRDRAVKMKWATRAGLFGRVADVISDQLPGGTRPKRRNVYAYLQDSWRDIKRLPQ